MGELVALLPLSQPAVSKHLRVLREAGLVEAQHRGAAPHLPGVPRAAARGGRLADAVSPAVGRAPRRARTSPRAHGRRWARRCRRDRGGRRRWSAAATSPSLRFRRRLAQPPETVWAALTEDEHLEEWFPTTIEGARAAGAALHYAFRQGEGEPFDGQMTAFEPPSLMELRWADDLLRFELERRRFRLRPVADRHVSRTWQGRPGRHGLARLPRTALLRLRGCAAALVAAGSLASGLSALRGAAFGAGGLGHRSAPGRARRPRREPSGG